VKRDTVYDALLRAPAGEGFLPVVTSFAETAGAALGLGRSEALELTLAAEEVFGHLCRVVLPKDAWVEIRCSGGGYYVRMDFSFPDADFDMRAFNLTASVLPGDEGDFDQMGLLLASRSVDRFRMVREDGRSLKLTLVKEKSYPSTEAGPPPLPWRLDSFSLKSPDAEELKLFAQLAKAAYAAASLPDVFHYPGKLVDMAAGGECRAVLAVGPSGEIGGGTLWHWTGEKAVEWLGPYVFAQDSDSTTTDAIATALLEHCIAAIARTSAVVLINRFPTPQFPRQSFEALGSFRKYDPDGTSLRRDAWARLLQEDPGSVVYTHPRLQPFVREELDRLVLPREVRIVSSQGEKHSRYSVLLTAFDRLQGSVTIDPVWFGEDFSTNLARHLDLFRREQILDVFFTMDLGQSWQAGFTPGLLENGFKPCCTLPYAGTGDVVIFQLDQGAVP
jgi:hypothetical protein